MRRCVPPTIVVVRVVRLLPDGFNEAADGRLSLPLLSFNCAAVARTAALISSRELFAPIASGGAALRCGLERREGEAVGSLLGRLNLEGTSFIRRPALTSVAELRHIVRRPHHSRKPTVTLHECCRDYHALASSVCAYLREASSCGGLPILNPRFSLARPSPVD